MPLVEDMERKGAWLFRWRGILPVLLIPGSLLVAYGDDMSPAFNDPRWVAICVGVGVLGQIIRALTIGYVPKGTSGRNTSEGQVAMVLNTKGMYSFVRHPLYLGNFFMWLGLVLYTGSNTLSICVSIAFWIYFDIHDRRTVPQRSIRRHLSQMV
jgi:protein-S-isoprenylcysteine O-methyltransferase Ste14